MKAVPSSPVGHFTIQSFIFLCILFLSALISVSTGCGSGATNQPPPKLSGNTSVTVLLSSTANDQLSAFGIGFTGITLTDQSGKTVNLFSTEPGTQQWAEFLHVNGTAEPFVTVSVPQGIYTAAAVSVADSYFTCVTLTPAGGLDTSYFAYGFNPTNAPPTTVTVNMPAALTVTGDSMALSLDMQVSQSASLSSCYDPNGNYSYSIQPTFNLSPSPVSSHPTNSANGKMEQLEGQISSLGTTGNNFTLALPVGPRTLSISSDANTEYQGISDFSSLATGTFVDMDGALQPDGSLLATRIAVEDPSAVDVLTGLGIVVGGDPLNGETSMWFLKRLSQGPDAIGVDWPFNVHSAAFQITGQLKNLATLPFVPSFNSSNIVAGQNTYVSTLSLSINSDPYPHAATVTLMPQTVDGTVMGSSSSGNFTVYDVSLASYNLFPALAVQQGQTTVLSNPSQIEVYVDGNAQQLNHQALAAGSTLRFYGLIFNDNGTLRMDCARVNDGVSFLPPPSSNGQLKVGQSRTIRHQGAGRQRQTTTVITLTR